MYVIIMKKLYKFKLNKQIVLSLACLIIISIVSIYSASNMVNKGPLMLKQIIWYILGIFVVYKVIKIGNNKIYKYYKILYIIGILSLVSLLLFAKPINNSKCWFTVFGIGTIQPSEFMKIILIITNAVIIDKHNKSAYKKDYVLILKIMGVTLIPSILTFLQPDTGMVLIYFVISFVMLFTSGINIKWFIWFIAILTLLLSVFLSLYFYNDDLFIKIFGTSFFYRIDRLLDWKDGVGMQLTNALIGIGSAFIFGHGFNNTPIYFPEPQTDFIFSVFATNYGLVGATFLLLILVYFDFNIIKIAINSRNRIDKYVVSGILAMLIYQQIQNIGMNIGLLPITGITLPFISYGGSSLLSYMIIIGILLNISNKGKKTF